MSRIELSFTEVRQTLLAVGRAIELGERAGNVPADILSALAKSQSVLTHLVDSGRMRSVARHDGSIEWTLVDESSLPQLRELDVRVYFNWIDYSPGDNVTPGSGGYAEICDLEVLAVRHLDEHGEEVGAAPHYTELAWQLVEEEKGDVEEACTSAGHRGAVGATHPLYQPLPDDGGRQMAELRMAPSHRRRAAAGKKKFG